MFLEDETIDVAAETETHRTARNAAQLAISVQSLNSDKDKIHTIILEYCTFLLVKPDCFLFADKAFFSRYLIDEAGRHPVEVYETTHQDDKKVIKKMFSDPTKRPAVRAQLHQAEEIWNSLYDSKKAAFVGENHRCLFFAMPFLGEMNLGKAFKDYPSIADHFKLVLAAAIAIHEMHQKFILHNDLYPGNIRISVISMIPQCFRAYVIDMDDAKRMAEKDKPTKDIDTFCRYILEYEVITNQNYPTLYQLMTNENADSLTPLISQLELEIKKLDNSVELSSGLYLRK